MANIKVTYGQISRRFKISSTTTWSAFESQLRSLFKIPTNTQITVSYSDEDGDVITLSSDLELSEVLSPAREYNSDKLKNSDDSSLKFVLTVSSDEDAQVDNNSWMFEGSTVNTKKGRKFNSDNNSSNGNSDDENYSNHVIYSDSEGNSGEGGFSEDNEKQVSINAPEYKHVSFSEETEEPSFEPTIPSVHESQNEEENQRKSETSQLETVGETSSSAFFQPSSSSSNSDAKQNEGQSPDQGEQDPVDNDNLDSLGVNFVIPNSFLQPPFFSPIAHLLFSRHTRFSDRRYSPFSRRCGQFSHWRAYHRQGRCVVGSIFKGIVKTIIMISLFVNFVKLSFIAFCPLITIFLLWKGLNFVNGFHNRRGYYDRWIGVCESNREECEGSGDEGCNEFGNYQRPFLSQRCGTCTQLPISHNISETDIKERLEILKSMGFSENDKKLEELVRRYRGNLNRVLDQLLVS